ncbi:MAG: IS256 family transposase [Spirochaetes bacterium]|nr:IS256 family transposase [Spirochaetota bacterium]
MATEEDIEKLLEGIDFKNLTAEQLTGKNGLLKVLTKRLVEKAMTSEMDQHLGYPKHDPAGKNSGNSRNGKSKKSIITDHGSIPIEVPRDRNGDFEPQIVKKRQRRFDGFDDKIISMYGRGITTRDIQSHLKDIYGVEVSPEFISNVTDAVIEDAREWQNRPLDPFYAIVYFDAIIVKGRSESRVVNKAVYTAIGVNIQGKKEALGLWISENEGAKFWAGIMTELKNRGVTDILIACIDGLKGLPEAINSLFPKTRIQLCIVHMIRNSTKFVSYKERKEICTDLKKIYSAITEEEGSLALDSFGEKWDKKYPMISKSWRTNWNNLNEFFGYPDSIRKIIYTTNAIESLNFSLRKVTKNRSAFPTDDAIIKLLYLSLTNASKKWTMPIRDWGTALNQFAIYFGERVPL